MEEIRFEEVAARLNTARFGKRIVAVESVSSTNDLARQEAENGAPEGTVIVAEEQTAGRGRLGRSWHSPPGLGIWMSTILRPEVSPDVAPALTFCASLAVARAVSALHPVSVSLKWPNDVLVNERKVCGILTEMKAVRGSVEFVICGVGINVNQTAEDFPAELRESAISLLTATGKKADRIELFTAVIEQMEMLYEGFRRDGASACIAEWRCVCPFFGKRVRVRTRVEVGVEAEQEVQTEAEGIFFDVEDSGALVLRLDTGMHRTFVAGDVELV